MLLKVIKIIYIIKWNLLGVLRIMFWNINRILLMRKINQLFKIININKIFMLGLLAKIK